ncbi:hypothetical protein LguiB_015801 [Lonicera macranthoides]
MASQAQEAHFILLPLMAPGHIIPIIDIAKLLAHHGAIATIITTPSNAQRFKTNLTRATQSGLKIRLLELPFPCAESGLPEGCDNFDKLPSMDYAANFFVATSLIQEPVEHLVTELKPQPNCIISDMGFPWTTDLAHKLHIPRIVFHVTCCFSLLCSYNLLMYKAFDEKADEFERFVVPGLPDRIELTKSQLFGMVKGNSSSMKDVNAKIRESEKAAYGIVVNTFEELEGEYVKEYRKARGQKVWCIGPVSLCNKSNLDKAERTDLASTDVPNCLKWLDSQERRSVLYVCLGSLSRLATLQMIELGLGLEESNRPFIWCIRHKSEELERWILEGGFEERTKGRGLLIYGWAPQVLILSHAAIGGFFTHCGWNSILEGVCAGVPMITWPMFAEQFYNEKLVVKVLKIGVSVGIEVPILIGEEEKVGVLLKKDDVKMVVNKLMDEGEEGGERRERAKELGGKANTATEEGGSSYLNMKLLIQDIMELQEST